MLRPTLVKQGGAKHAERFPYIHLNEEVHSMPLNKGSTARQARHPLFGFVQFVLNLLAGLAGALRSKHPALANAGPPSGPPSAAFMPAESNDADVASAIGHNTAVDCAHITGHPMDSKEHWEGTDRFGVGTHRGVGALTSSSARRQLAKMKCTKISTLDHHGARHRARGYHTIDTKNSARDVDDDVGAVSIGEYAHAGTLLPA
jgi:hypothetical protein